MKITDPDVIKNGEKDLIEAVKEDLDLNAIKEILKKRMAAAAISSQGGEIIVHNNEIAFRLDFDIQLSGSLIFDRQGNYIPESDETDDPENFISEDLDFDNITISETLEEVTPQTVIDDPEVPEINDENIDDDFDRDIDEEIDIDDDIDDILKESRDFWEQKKES